MEWVEDWRIGDGTIELSSDGTGRVEEFSVRGPGEACNPAGDRRVTTDITWRFKGDEHLVFTVDGQEVLAEVGILRAVPNWDRLWISLCGDSQDADFISYEGVNHWQY